MNALLITSNTIFKIIVYNLYFTYSFRENLNYEEDGDSYTDMLADDPMDGHNSEVCLCAFFIFYFKKIYFPSQPQ